MPNKVPNKLAGSDWIIADKSGCQHKFNQLKTMTYKIYSDFCGQSWSLNYLYGVQGVASSNPAAPTNNSLSFSYNLLKQ